jgi:threonine synthase
MIVRPYDKTTRKDFMRQEKTIQIDGKSVMVKELRAADVIELIEGSGTNGIAVLVGVQAGMPSDMKKLMAKSVDMSAEEFEDIVEGINGFTAVEQAFKEVNADFFVSLPQRINELLEKGELMENQVKRSLKLPAGSSKKGT